MTAEKTSECPLCGTDFPTAGCHGSCPVAKGCAMIRCPQCGYEFVERSSLLDTLRRWWRGRSEPSPARASAEGFVSVTRLRPGVSAQIARVATHSAARLDRLSAYGIIAGSRIEVVTRKPVLVVRCGATSVALEDEIGREIEVEPASVKSEA